MASGLRFVTANPVTAAMDRQATQREKDSLVEDRDWNRAKEEASLINEGRFVNEFQKKMGGGANGVPAESPKPTPASGTQVASSAQAPSLGGGQPAAPARVAPQPRPATTAPTGGQAATDALARAAMATPGMGYKGAQMMVQAANDRDAQEREQLKTVLETAKTDPAVALAMMDKWGIQMPDDFKSLLGDRVFVGRMKDALDRLEAEAKARYPRESQRAQFIESQMKRVTAALVGDAHQRQLAQGGGAAPASAAQPAGPQPAATGGAPTPQGPMSLRDVFAQPSFDESPKPAYRSQDVVWVDNLGYTRDQTSGNLTPFFDPRTNRQIEKAPEYQTTTDADGNTLYYDTRNPVARQMRDQNDNPVRGKRVEPTERKPYVAGGRLWITGANGRPEAFVGPDGQQMAEPKNLQRFTDNQGFEWVWNQQDGTAYPMNDQNDNPVRTKGPEVDSPTKSDMFESGGYWWRWQGNKAVAVTDENGNQLKADDKSGKGGTSVWQSKYDAWLAQHPKDIEGALRYAVSSGGGMSPAELRKFSYKVASDQLKAEFENTARETAPTEQEIRAKSEDIYNYLVNGAEGAPVGQAAAAAPSGKPPIPAPLQSRKQTLQWSPSARKFRDSATGEIFNEDGTTAQ